MYLTVCVANRSLRVYLVVNFRTLDHKLDRTPIIKNMYLTILLFFLGDILCEHLPTTVCSFAIASSGKRCLLENGYQCKTLEVVAKRMAPYIEIDTCVSACGLNRNSVGISSDKFLEPQFLAKLSHQIITGIAPTLSMSTLSWLMQKVNFFYKERIQ